MSSSDSNRDRTVHAALSTGGEIVRYDRAGKWFLEYPEGNLMPRRPLTLKAAVNLAADPNATVFLRRPGGTRFDSEVVKRIVQA